MTPPTITVRVHHPLADGSRITLRGNGAGLAWEKGLETTFIAHTDLSGKGFWEVRLQAKDQLPVEFKPLINDEIWSVGANYLLNTSTTLLDIYPYFHHAHGTLDKTYEFHSQILGNSRKIITYLPPSYHQNTHKSYPVLFMNDGHNLFEAEGSYAGRHWDIATTMDRLCNQGKVAETIIVGVVPVDRTHEYLPTKARTPFGIAGGGAEKYVQFLLKELKPYISGRYRASVAPGSLGIAGSSYGGLISLYAWLAHPDEFALCGAFSPSVYFDNRIFFRMLENDEKQRLVQSKLYVDSGSPNDGLGIIGEFNNLAVNKVSNGWMSFPQYTYVVGEGHTHSEECWALRAPDALTFLLKDHARHH
eukprot:TRINITY_DN7919_c0_g1_i3.p1 TRINITY_DN7919_c0_g1~~TRINITY_DN7919_c0_g1_i3.p1  ORF type:complete len:382 (-),score=68.89 TRINITY_DN7919_c0_g1_i3:63-1145(-)